MDNKSVNDIENSSDQSAAEERKDGTGKTEGIFGFFRKTAKHEGELDRDLRKLTRTELLEMLIDETKEADRLRLENQRLQKELERVREELARTASLDIVIAKLEGIINKTGYRN